MSTTDSPVPDTADQTAAVPEQPPAPPRDAANWAKPVAGLAVGAIADGAINRNVEGKRLTGPLQGFGKLWQKTYRVALEGADVTAGEVIRTWKDRFSEFWPDGNRFYGPLTGIAPGEVAVLNLKMPGRITLSTGIMVVYADDESFTFMTPEGHMLAGLITFSASERDGTVHAQVQVLMRTQNLLSEVGAGFGGHRKEDRFWQHALGALASNFGMPEPQVTTDVVCVDKKRQWKHAFNVRHDAALRSAAYQVTHPFRGRAKRGA